MRTDRWFRTAVAEPESDPRRSFREELRDRRLHARAARALREAGITSADEIYAMHRFDLLRIPGLGPRAFDLINDALNKGDVDRIEGLFRH
jgi:DNA-directed RNA polymerase alpha subunit